MDKNPFLKRLIKENTQEVVHSSAYAKAQSDNMGVASTESFAERRWIDSNRQMVRGYRDSKIVSERVSGAPRAKTYEPEEGSASSRFESARISIGPKSSPMADGSGGLSSSGVSAGVKKGSAAPPARKNPGIFR